MNDPADEQMNLEWQSRLYDVVHGLSVSLRDLDRSNPWPDRPVLEEAMNVLATELWDQCFSQTEIIASFEKAMTNLPRYTAGEDVRP